MSFWEIFYNTIIVPLGWIGFQFFGLFNHKIRRGIHGRENLFETLEEGMNRLNPAAKRVWFHSSSMGEFEQAKPIITELKRRYSDVEVIVSFFSPSGYDNSRTYKLADIITYLPFDSKVNAERFISIIKPSVAVMVRYDVWPNHLWALKRAGVPIFIANATYRKGWSKNAPFIKSFFYEVYNSIDSILTVSENDRRGFEEFQLRFPAIEAIGDTRFDQVWRRSSESRKRHVLPRSITEGKKIFILGSTWEEDEHELFPAIIEFSRRNEDFLSVIVPHEPHEQTLERIEYHLNGSLSSIRFSSLGDYNGERLILVDSIGILMALYQYSHIAYVGGSFAQGIHNVLEPAVYGQPLLIGPKHENSQEAVQMVQEGAAFVVTGPDDALRYLEDIFTSETLRLTAGQAASEFVKRNIGATGRFLARLEKVL